MTTQAQALARALVTARNDDRLFEHLLAEAVGALLDRCYCETEDDRRAVQERLAAALEAFVTLASVSLAAADDAVGAKRGTARSIPTVRTAGRGPPGGRGFNVNPQAAAGDPRPETRASPRKSDSR